MAMYEHPQVQRCDHTVMRVQVFRQGCHAQCFQCGAMAMYPNGIREAGVIAHARIALDEAYRQMQEERAHVQQYGYGYGRPADPSLPLGAAMRRAPGWWGR